MSDYFRGSRECFAFLQLGVSRAGAPGKGLGDAGRCGRDLGAPWWTAGRTAGKGTWVFRGVCSLHFKVIKINGTKNRLPTPKNPSARRQRAAGIPKGRTHPPLGGTGSTAAGRGAGAPAPSTRRRPVWEEAGTQEPSPNSAHGTFPTPAGACETRTCPAAFPRLPGPWGGRGRTCFTAVQVEPPPGREDTLDGRVPTPGGPTPGGRQAGRRAPGCAGLRWGAAPGRAPGRRGCCCSSLTKRIEEDTLWDTLCHCSRRGQSPAKWGGRQQAFPDDQRPKTKEETQGKHRPGRSAVVSGWRGRRCSACGDQLTGWGASGAEHCRPQSHLGSCLLWPPAGSGSIWA